MLKITIIGTTTWGITLGIMLARKELEVSLWARTEREAKKMNTAGLDPAQFPGVSVPPNLHITSHLDEAMKAPKDESESWVEMDGQRITSMDLKLRSEASRAVWDQYRNGDIDAKSLEEAWEELGEHSALEELRERDREAKKEAAEKALEKAKEHAKKTEERAKETNTEAANAKKMAAEAKAYADKICKEADDCVKVQRARPDSPSTDDSEYDDSDLPRLSESSNIEAIDVVLTTEELFQISQVQIDPKVMDGVSVWKYAMSSLDVDFVNIPVEPISWERGSPSWYVGTIPIANYPVDFNFEAYWHTPVSGDQPAEVFVRSVGFEDALSVTVRKNGISPSSASESIGAEKLQSEISEKFEIVVDEKEKMISIRQHARDIVEPDAVSKE